MNVCGQGQDRLRPGAFPETYISLRGRSPCVVQSLCPRCGKHTDGEMLDHDLYILVVCEMCEVILGVVPKYYQKATWKAGRARDVEPEPAAVSVPDGKGARPTRPAEVEPGAAVIRDLEKKQRREQDRRLRWS